VTKEFLGSVDLLENKALLDLQATQEQLVLLALLALLDLLDLLDLKETQGQLEKLALLGLQEQLVQQAQLVLALAMVTQRAISSIGMGLDGRTWR